jgi:transcriptional regulator with XRE-family HTH domain
MSYQQVLKLRTKMLGAMLREARQRSGKSIKDSAGLIGTSPSTFSSYEHGRKAISLPELEVFAFRIDQPLMKFIAPRGELIEKKATFNASALITLRQKMIGASLRQRRKESDLTIRELSEATGVSEYAIGSYERGERPIPLPELEILLQELGQSVEDYVDQDGPIGRWIAERRACRRVLELPKDLREFITDQENEAHLRMAQRLSELSADRLRQIAESLLDLAL